LDLYLDNELLVETSQSVLEHLSACPDCAAEVERRLELRRLLKAISPLDDERESVAENALRRKIEAALQKDQRRRVTTKMRWAVLAACLILIAGLGYWRIRKIPKPPSPPAINLSPPAVQIAATDRDAVGNHQACALTYPPNWAYDRQRIVRELTPRFASLIDVIGRNHGSYELIEGHICSFQQRRYAHLIFRGNGHTVSVFIEQHEQVAKADSSPALEIGQTHYLVYEVASVDTGIHRIYVVSDLPSGENATLAKQLFPRTLTFVQKMERGGA
jgi:anti-sigma factor RsiW